MEPLHLHPLYRVTNYCMSLSHVSSYLGYQDKRYRTVRNLVKTGELTYATLKDTLPVGHTTITKYITLESLNAHLLRQKMDWMIIDIPHPTI